jgi:ribosomal protein L3 glutamine methyltransferase
LTLAELIRRVEQRFASAPLFYGHGTDNAHDEATWLVLRSLGLPFDADLEAAASSADQRRVEALAARRIDERLPVAYLLKEAWLAGQPFHVDPRVIVPRSHIAELLGSFKRRPPRRVLDLCTGSGCLAILAARAFRQAEVDAVDISPGALAVAGKNVARYRLGRRVHPKRSDLFAALRGVRYDLILTNPPYVSSAAMGRLPPEYRHEPRLALAGGADGLDLVGRILASAPSHLEPGGALICEIGDRQAAVKRRFRGVKLAWPKPEVFIAERASLVSASNTVCAARRHPTRSPAKR